MVKHQNSSWIQGTPEWKEMRHHYIMASDAPIIMGVSTYSKDVVQLWEEKIGIAPEETLSSKQKKDFEWGRAAENYAREQFMRITGVSVSPKVMFSDKISYLGASLDGISDNHHHLLEIKATHYCNHELAKNHHIPKEFMPQLQHQLFVTNLPEMTYLSVYGGDIAVVHVKRDDHYINQMLEKYAYFWECVRNFTSPEKLLPPKKVLPKEEWEQKALTLLQKQEQKRELDKEIKDLTKEVLSAWQQSSHESDIIEVLTSERKGTVDYSQIPELQDVDLDAYRKPSTINYTIRKKT